MSEKDFNWMERILDNHKLPKSVRALFGCGIVLTVCIFMALVVSIFDLPVATVTGTPAYYFGLFGFVVWYAVIYKLVSWSDKIKEQS